MVERFHRQLKAAIMAHESTSPWTISLPAVSLSIGSAVKELLREKLGTDIPSHFLWPLQKTAGFGASAVVGKAVIRQAFIRQMLISIRAHSATQPDSTLLESLATLADRALASENDAKEAHVGVAEIQVNESTKLI